ncbi:MAG: ATP phosphoribosyltransferase [Xanthomonadales bacterium]|nr:ATP phosphoribosyltransferase [Gammaproteobacteria bacterium]MBT8051817.1 ATP phosphoribosyltransferase [Gammaproteobacteria bacterium]MBT8057802.1 ATP phosphoribosyltransferase [Gammaproteobacteria bacterium]NNJ77811.1 ATP phosphoribosyltransferase [Xanthomonadales bacterium]NNL04650.1 ATP phosphoribosyltransferase [Xanthomonadales bacterium]
MNNENQARLRVAIQKSGRLSEQSQEVLKNCGLRFARSKDKLFWYGRDFPVDLLLVRDDDIPRLLLDGVCELGIVGENIAWEVMLDRGREDGLERLSPLGFGHCRLSIAVPEQSGITDIKELDGVRVATSYPALTHNLLQKSGVEAEISELSGAVEIAPSMGTADAISDLVSTGTTLRANHLKELQVLFRSEAALYSRTGDLGREKQALIDLLISRLNGVMQARASKYVMLHAPKDALEKITELLPGVEYPSVMPLEGSDRIAVHAVCGETVFWEHLEALKAAGASAILVLPVEKMLA